MPQQRRFYAGIDRHARTQCFCLLDLREVGDRADRLRRAGWSCGDFATAGGWTVIRSNGENVLQVTASRHALAWWRAVEAARALGVLR